MSQKKKRITKVNSTKWKMQNKIYFYMKEYERKVSGRCSLWKNKYEFDNLLAS